MIRLNTDFWKANIFRIILAVYMVILGGFVSVLAVITIFRIIVLGERDGNGLWGVNLALAFVLLLTSLCPLIITLCSLAAHRDDPYLPYTPTDIFVRVLLTLLKMIIYTAGSGVILFFIY